MELVMSDKIVVGAKTPLDFIDSLPNGEAKITAMVVYQMCRILEIANGELLDASRAKWHIDHIDKIRDFNETVIMCGPLVNGTIRPTGQEGDKLDKSEWERRISREFNICWVKRDLETGLLLRYSDGCVETFSTRCVMSNTLYPHQPQSSRFRYELYLGDQPCASDAV
jgi:hypothetical protein